MSATATSDANANLCTKIGRAPQNQLLRLHLCLQSTNVQDLKEHIRNISTPHRSSYGNHLSRKAIQQYFQPVENAKTTVAAWLQAHRVAGLDEHASTHFQISTTVQQAEALLDTEFYVYRHDVTNHTVVRTVQYSVPAMVQDYVLMIQPTTKFPRIETQATSKTSFAGAVEKSPDQPEASPPIPLSYDREACNITISPGCLRGLYGLQNVNATHEELAYSLGIAGFLNQVAHWDDWGLFVDNLAPWVRKPFNFSIVSLNHASNMQNDTVHASHEASLDVQYAMALAPHINTFSTQLLVWALSFLMMISQHRNTIRMSLTLINFYI